MSRRAASSPVDPDDDELLDLHQTALLVGRPETTVRTWAMYAEWGQPPRGPVHVQLDGKGTGRGRGRPPTRAWRGSAVEAWLRERDAARGKQGESDG